MLLLSKNPQDKRSAINHSLVTGLLHLHFKVLPCCIYQHCFYNEYYSIVWTYHILSIHQLMDTWIASTFWILWLILFICVLSFWVDISSCLLGIYLEVQLLGQMFNQRCFNLLRNCQTVFKAVAPPIVYEDSNFSTSPS